MSEDQLTTALRAVVENDFRRTGCVTGFNTKTFESVTRQAQVANYNGTKIGKMPDLCFRLQPDDQEEYSGLSEYDALFVECKPVDRSHPVGGKYCDAGLIRFIEGDYAWAMQDAMMLAYARDGRRLITHLLPVMKEVSRMKSLATVQQPQPLSSQYDQGMAGADLVHVSRHRRSFNWPDDKGLASNITVYHVWFDCN